MEIYNALHNNGLELHEISLHNGEGDAAKGLGNVIGRVESIYAITAKGDILEQRVEKLRAEHADLVEAQAEHSAPQSDGVVLILFFISSEASFWPFRAAIAL